MEMKLRWQLALIIGVPLIGYIVSLFWHPSTRDVALLAFLWVQFFVLLPTWKQLDRIERKLDDVSQRSK